MFAAELNDANLLFRALFEQNNDAVFVMNLDGVHLATNRRAADMLGYMREEIVGLSFRDIIPVEEQPDSEHIRDRMLNGEDIPVYERSFRRKDGTLCPTEVNVQMVRDDHENPLYILSIVRDISARKASEQQVVRLSVEEERSEILSEFIISASHEFRTPLSNINASLHILRRVEDAAERDKRMTIIQNQVDRIANLVSKMLLMTRLDSTGMLNFVPLDLSDIVYDAEVSLSRMLEQRRIQIDHEISYNLPSCEGDLRYLHLAFTEVLDNAIKFSPIDSRIKVKTTATRAHVVASITDAGVGITPTDTPRIFERFFRGDRSHQYAGFGLGLSIARRIIEQHGGRIEVESEAGVGSTFRVMLPVVQEAVPVMV